MDVMCSTGFGLDVNSQRDPNNQFVEQAKAFLDIGVSGNPIMILSCKSNNQKKQNFHFGILITLSILLVS